MSDLQKLTMRREDVDALEDAADTLMRRSATEQATRLYALVMRLRTEAGWTPTGGYSTRERMNDYVGPPITATVTWDSECPEAYELAQGKRHNLGLLSQTCLRCGAVPTIEYDAGPSVRTPENVVELRRGN